MSHRSDSRTVKPFTLLKSLSEIADLQTLQSLIKGLRVCCMQRVYGNNVYLSEIAQIYQPQTISSTELTEDGFLYMGQMGLLANIRITIMKRNKFV